MRIYLTGMMGCGKTTVGKILSSVLHLPFFDLDEEVEKSEGKTIANIFREDSEHYFREIESQKLEELTRSNEHMILSTGGGTPCFKDQMSFMLKSGFVVYLRCSSEVLTSRLSLDVEKRPLLSSPDKTTNEIIEALLGKREIFYQAANLVVDGHRAPEELSQEITNHLKLILS
jgi:shikimate kinase